MVAEKEPRVKSKLAFTIALFITSLGLITGCSQQPAKMTTQEWCVAVQSELRENSVGWPVANQKLDRAQVEAIILIFDEYAPRAEGMLETAARGWSQGFVPMSEYLLSDDQESYRQNVSESLQNQLFLSSVEINNQCGWFEWK